MSEELQVLGSASSWCTGALIVLSARPGKIMFKWGVAAQSANVDAMLAYKKTSKRIQSDPVMGFSFKSLDKNQPTWWTCWFHCMKLGSKPYMQPSLLLAIKWHSCSKIALQESMMSQGRMWGAHVHPNFGFRTSRIFLSRLERVSNFCYTRHVSKVFQTHHMYLSVPKTRLFSSAFLDEIAKLVEN